MSAQVLNQIGFNALYEVAGHLLILVLLSFLKPRVQENGE